MRVTIPQMYTSNYVDLERDYEDEPNDRYNKLCQCFGKCVCIMIILFIITILILSILLNI
jgi:hypothetical protein